MKLKKFFSCALALSLSLILLPLDSNIVKGKEEKKPIDLPIKECHIVKAMQYKDKTLLIVQKDAVNDKEISTEQLIEISKNKTTIIKDNSPSLHKLINMGVYQEKMYLLNPEEKDSPVYTYDFKNHQLKFSNFAAKFNISKEKPEDYDVYYLSGIIDNNGTQWFSVVYINNKVYTQGIAESDLRYYAVINNKNFKHETECSAYNASHQELVLGHDNKVWFTQYNSADQCKLYCMKNDNTYQELTLPNKEYAVNKILVDKKENIILKSHFTRRVYSPNPIEISKPWEIYEQYSFKNGKLELSPNKLDTTGWEEFKLDYNDNLWVLRYGPTDKFNGLYKLEDNKLVAKYKICHLASEFDIYDENHLIAYDGDLYNLINNGEISDTPNEPAKPSTPQAKPKTGNTTAAVNKPTLPETGSKANLSLWISLGCIVTLAGSVLFFKHKI